MTLKRFIYDNLKTGPTLMTDDNLAYWPLYQAQYWLSCDTAASLNEQKPHLSLGKANPEVSNSNMAPVVP